MRMMLRRFFINLSCIRRSMTRLPLDAAADARPLSTIDGLTREHGLDGGAKITAGHRFAIAGTTIVQLPTIDEPTVMIEEIKVRSTGSTIGFCNLLCFVVTEWKGEAQALGHFFQLRRRIIGISTRVVTADGEKSQACIQIVSPNLSQLLLDMHDVRTVPADEHDKEPGLPHERVERVLLPSRDVL